MATEESRSVHRGLGIPNDRVEVWSDEASASYQQAGPLPGIPEPQHRTPLKLEATGDQASGTTYSIKALRGGFPVANDAAFVWKHSTDSSTSWRGWDVPNAITATEAITFTTGTGQSNPHAVTLSDDTVVVCYEYQDSGTQKIGTRIRGTDGTWSSEEVAYGETGTTDLYPSMVVLPSGRILLFHFTYDATNNEAQVQALYSDDSGETWSVGAEQVLPSALDTTGSGDGEPLRVRAAYGNGQILLVLWIRDPGGSARERLWQYAGSDDGMSVELVEDWNGTSGQAGGYPDVAFSGGWFIVAYYDAEDGGSGQGRARRISNAFRELSGVTEVSLLFGADFDDAGDDSLDDGDIALAVDDTGHVYLFGRSFTASGSGAGHWAVAARSADYGDSWVGMGDGSFGSHGSWWQAEEGLHPSGWCATFQRGRALIVHNMTSTSTTYDTSLWATYLGGASQVTMPPLSLFNAGETAQAGFEYTWIAAEDPASLTNMFTTTTTGSPTATLTNGRLRQQGVSTERLTYTAIESASGGSGYPSGTVDEGLYMVASVQVDAGKARIRMLVDDGTQGFEIRVDVTPTQIEVFDTVAGSSVATAAISSSTEHQILVAIAGSNATAWYREYDTGADREWTQIGTTSSLTDSGAGGTGNNELEWGTVTPATASFDLHWRAFRWQSGGYGTAPWTGTNSLATDPTNPTDLFPREFAGPAHVDQGLRIAGANGPAIKGDEWSIPVRYTHGVDNLLTGSPRKTWRSTSTNAQVIPFRWSSVGDSATESDVLVIAGYGSNVSSIDVDLYDDDTSSWSSAGTATLYTRLSGLSYTRNGDTVIPSTGNASTNEPYLDAEEFAGGAFWFGSLGSVTRSILHHSGGKWTDSAQKRPVLILDGVDDTEPASGSTSAAILPPSWVILVHLLGGRYSGVRLSIAAAAGSIPEPAESYWEIGRLVIGHLEAFGEEYSWGYLRRTTPGTELRTARDRTMRSRVVAPSQREFEMGWVDGVDLTETTDPDGDPDPRYAFANDDASAEAVANLRSTPYQLEGLIRRLDGPNEPVVYLPRVPSLSGGSTMTVLNRRSAHALIRLTEPVEITNVQGDELEDEVVRVPTLRGIEEV